MDVSNAKLVDHTCIMTLNGLTEDYKRAGGNFKIEGFHNHRQLGHAPTSARVLKTN